MVNDETAREQSASVGGSRLSGVDLNLIVPLQALLEERSVSRAADRLFMSQPALSSALGRLRRQFDDELLVRSGNRYVLSQLAGELLPEVQSTASALAKLFGAQTEFDPGTSEREFRIVCSDYVAAVFGARLSKAVSIAAPRAMLRIEQLRDELVDEAPDSLRGIDGLILPHGFIEHTDYIDLFEDAWCCLVAASGDGAPELDIAALGARPWATTFSGRTAVIAASRELHHRGIYPRTQVTTRSFLTLPDMVTGTDRVAFLPASAAARFADRTDVSVVDSPLPLPPIRQAFWWNGATFGADAGHRWLRELIAGVAARHARGD